MPRHLPSVHKGPQYFAHFVDLGAKLQYLTIKTVSVYFQLFCPSTSHRSCITVKTLPPSSIMHSASLHSSHQSLEPGWLISISENSSKLFHIDTQCHSKPKCGQCENFFELLSKASDKKIKVTSHI